MKDIKSVSRQTTSGGCRSQNRRRSALIPEMIDMSLLTEGISVGILAEHLLNNRLQTRVYGATVKVVTLTKQMKIGRCEQVRVN